LLKPGKKTLMIATCIAFTLHERGLSAAAKLLHWTAVTMVELA